MKFTLTYEGRLPSSGNKPKNEDKWRIRKMFHPQLVDLCQHHPALRQLRGPCTYPLEGGIRVQAHHSYEGKTYIPEFLEGGPPLTPIDLNSEIEKHGRRFRPLVRETYAVHCGLQVLFLRHEPPGRIYQGGDIDGRMKTLLDALAMPRSVEQVLSDEDCPDPLYCLVEDDSMISGLSIESERLLGAQNQPADYAKITIEVDVRIAQPTLYNQLFAGT